MSTPEEQIASLENEVKLLDALNLNLQETITNLQSSVVGLVLANNSLHNDVNFQAKSMLEISRTVGLPVEGQSMATLAAWIQDHWKP